MINREWGLPFRKMGVALNHQSSSPWRLVLKARWWLGIPHDETETSVVIRAASSVKQTRVGWLRYPLVN